MNWAFVIAGFASLAIAFGHSILGERFIVMPLTRQASFPALFGSDVIARRGLRLTWHVATMMTLAVAALFIALSFVELDTGARLAVYSIVPIYGVTAIWVALMSKGRRFA